MRHVGRDHHRRIAPLIALTALGSVACGSPLAARVERFSVPRTGELGVEAGPVALAYPNGLQLYGDEEPRSRLRAVVRLHNGTSRALQVCHHPWAERASRNHRIDVDPCVRIILEHGQESSCGDETGLPVVVLGPGEGAQLEICSVVDEPPPSTSVRVARSARTSREDEVLITRTGLVPVVSMPALPVWTGSYPTRAEGELEVRHVPRARMFARAETWWEEVGWLVAVDVWVRNATPHTLLIDTGAFRAESQPSASLRNDCTVPPPLVLLRPWNRDIVALAPGQTLERRVVWWHALRESDYCYYGAPTELQLRYAGQREAARVPVTGE